MSIPEPCSDAEPGPLGASGKSLCWAAPLGGCGGGVSREHVISAGALAREPFTVSGLAWQKGEIKSLSEKALRAKILCRDHNSALEPLDSEAALLVQAIERFCEKRERAVANVDGDRMLRWCMKTMINVVASGWAKGVRDLPPSDIVEAVFGRRPVDPRFRLATVSGFSNPPGAADTVLYQLQRLGDSGPIIVFLVSVRGLTLVLLLQEMSPNDIKAAVARAGWVQTPASLTLVTRPVSIDLEIDGATGPLTVVFAWPQA